jgi:hypothetical protein
MQQCAAHEDYLKTRGNRIDRPTLSSTARQKDGLIGSPYTRIWDGSSPRSSALLATSADGQ